MKKLLAMAVMVTGLLGTAAVSAETVVVGHFGNPTPMQIAAAQKKFSEATGWTVNWYKFASGTEVISALASGSIQIAELGSSPLAIAASQGVELELIMLAQVIGEAESLIVRNGAGINELSDLKDKKIAVPVGSTAHFSLMGALNKAGLAENEVQILNLPPDQIAAAWEQQLIDAAFIWQPVQSKILETGSRLVGADKTAEWGYPTFDGWVVDKGFAAENAEGVAKFLAVMDQANAAYLNNKAAWTADSAPVATIAAQTGAAPGQIPEILEGFTFLRLSEQVKPMWLGESVAGSVQATAEFLQSAGRIDSVASDYSRFVSADPAMSALK